jgi:predicted  nucleic acid-binding Zn-ribbon protein
MSKQLDKIKKRMETKRSQIARLRAEIRLLDKKATQISGKISDAIPPDITEF